MKLPCNKCSLDMVYACSHEFGDDAPPCAFKMKPVKTSGLAYPPKRCEFCVAWTVCRSVGTRGMSTCIHGSIDCIAVQLAVITTINESKKLTSSCRKEPPMKKATKPVAKKKPVVKATKKPAKKGKC